MFKLGLNETSTKVKHRADALNGSFCYLCHKMKKQPVSVLIIEPHPLMREALCLAIEEEPGLRVAGEAFDVYHALELLQQNLAVDVILFSLGSPGAQDMQNLAALHRDWSRIPILALTTNEVPGQEQAALEHGAQAALTKAEPRAKLLEYIRQIFSST